VICGSLAWRDGAIDGNMNCVAEPELTAWLYVFVEDDEIRFMKQIADGMDASEGARVANASP
jgi:hypothetical protein